MINQCLLYRYIISYEPYNFKGMPEDYPLTLAYGKQMDALRTELREYFWDGEFRDKVGATVLALPNAEGGMQKAELLIQHSALSIQRQAASSVCRVHQPEEREGGRGGGELR